MQPAMGVGAAVLTGLAAVGIVFLVVPDDEEQARSTSSVQDAQDAPAAAARVARVLGPRDRR